MRRILNSIELITLSFIAAFEEQSTKFNTAFTPKNCHVLMPSKRFCCGKILTIDPRYSSMKIYNVDP